MPVINLYPSYASEKQLNGVTYREYLQRYAAEVDVPYLSYDHYPLYGDGTKTWVQDRYLSDFETASDVCRQYNRQLWYFIQTLGFNKIVREPNEQDIRWQVYCALSFGARMIQLFTYGSPGDENGSTGDEVFELGLIDRQGEKTPRYEMVRRVLPGAASNRTGLSYLPPCRNMVIPALPVPEGWRKRWILPSPARW